MGEAPQHFGTRTVVRVTRGLPASSNRPFHLTSVPTAGGVEFDVRPGLEFDVLLSALWGIGREQGQAKNLGEVRQLLQGELSSELHMSWAPNESHCQVRWPSGNNLDNHSRPSIAA